MNTDHCMEKIRYLDIEIDAFNTRLCAKRPAEQNASVAKSLASLRLLRQQLHKELEVLKAGSMTIG